MVAVVISLALGGTRDSSVAPELVQVTPMDNATTLLPAQTLASDLWVGPRSEPLWLQLPSPSGTSVDIDGTARASRSTSGMAVLEGLARLTPAELSAFAASNPTAVDTILAAPPAASAVTRWWTGLDDAARHDLQGDLPQLVGNLDGIPLVARGQANARYLGEAVKTATARLTGQSGRSLSASLNRELSVMAQVQQALLPPCGSPPRTLVLLDLTKGGRAAIALGNPDTADFVSYLVPGMNYGVKEQLVNWSNTADDLYAEQVSVLRERAISTHTATPSVATIAWIGYETPSVFNVGGLDRAEAGADFLVDSWQGIRSTRAGQEPFLSVFAHSYGSLVSLEALARGSVQVDALVLVGSPGSAIQSIDRLNVANGNVYVGEADWDPAVNSGFFGSDPGSASYGAHTLDVDGGVDRQNGRTLNKSWGHNDYFTRGSESLHNMAVIGTDQAARATNASE
ncbi:alpha/beta hydrolase [Cryobacterium psychrophilum]|uniref:DUF1023 domain-containing protein n=1 Tax=Cryobacterium psychrophilum TaxID=41988 RepID=A0A4Y8KT11_9MICO|nr:alpha/beta hydrolase [Cryobacterium psychrophilum]TDW31261.1 alpha/beta hydrolase family protein [Cryobacterium psychrophilum]TFD78450.1 hypothetical protein E3T53_09660 [Cryobacterium psychrophilum]